MIFRLRTFLGFDGDKEPDIDRISPANTSLRYTAIPRSCSARSLSLRRAPSSALKDKTAYGYVKKYLSERGRWSIMRRKSVDHRCTGVKKTTGQHPGGMVVVPSHHEIYDFCPIQHPR